MKKTLFYALTLAITGALFGFSQFKPSNSGGKNPPGTVGISDNFYADKYEICNIDYNEYLYWIAHVFGKGSAEYQHAQLDKTVWEGFPNKEAYFEHPDFALFPVVGITLEQAKNYTVWRTDRVAEKLLHEENLIDLIKAPTPENYFSVERYKNGNYAWIIKKQEISIPVFKIPTRQEWELIAKGNATDELGTDAQSRYNKMVLRKNYNRLYNTRKYSDADPKHKIYDGPAANTAYAKNVNGLSHIIGNVSELIDEAGVAKGGSWQDDSKSCTINASQKVEGPNNWTGFRNISRWETIEVL